MDLIFDLILRRFIIRFLGVRVRYLFLRLFDKNLKFSTLKENEANSFYFDFLNAIVGLIVFIGISFLLAYIFF